MASSRKRTGKYEPEELLAIMKHVLARNGGKVDQRLPKGVDWEVLASQMNRTRRSVYDVYRALIHPVLLQYLTGTLDSDPRENLLKVVEQKGWVYSIMIDYQELVKMPEFEGHTTRTLCKIYFNMLECARKKFEMPTQRDVTVHQVRALVDKCFYTEKAE